VKPASPALLLAVLLLAGCGGRQSTLRTDSAPAGRIEHLWWIMFVGSTVVCAVVFVLVLAAVLRGRGTRAPSQTDSRGARGLMLFGGAVVPFVVLVALFVLILRTLPSTAQPTPGSASLRIDVIGHEWFWEVRYPQQHVVTANEIHIPAGRPVEVHVSTNDVIHSLWVPGLNRKMDTIPARDNRLLIDARHPGVYRGQCAEFCGLEHAKMGLLVFVDTRDHFRRWLAEQEKPAATTSGRGFEVFNEYGCSGCHTIRGTQAQGRLGPDLTHLASRTTLAAASIPNRRGDLGAWILDPQHVKPGNKMPGIDFNGPDLKALLDYLETLR
jgi:cytochrome c oxidase subunit 2